MKLTSAYLTALADEITNDLAQVVDPVNLMNEVNKTLKKQVLSATVQAIYDFSNKIEETSKAYGKTDEQFARERAAAETKMLRHFDYCKEMFGTVNRVSETFAGLLTAEQQRRIDSMDSDEASSFVHLKSID